MMGGMGMNCVIADHDITSVGSVLVEYVSGCV